jgi:hypothetical protein
MWMPAVAAEAMASRSYRVLYLEYNFFDEIYQKCGADVNRGQARLAAPGRTLTRGAI